MGKNDWVTDEELAWMQQPSLTQVPTDHSPQPVRESEVGRSVTAMGVKVVAGEFPPERESRSKYPWDLWMNGESHMIVRGGHFQVPTRNMVVQLHNRGQSREPKLYPWTVITNGDAIWFRYYKSKEERDAARDARKREEHKKEQEALARYADIDPHLEMDDE